MSVVHQAQAHAVRVDELGPRAIRVGPAGVRNTELGGPCTDTLGRGSIASLEDDGVLAPKVSVALSDRAQAQGDHIAGGEVREGAPDHLLVVTEPADVL